MPFGTIVAQTLNYAPRADGQYVLSSLQFGQPDNSFVIRAASLKANPARCSVSRVLQKDVVEGGSTVRHSATVTVSIVCPNSAVFTPTELSNLVTDAEVFITPDTVSRMLMSES